MSGSDLELDTSLRLLAICGALGPILYTVTLFALGLLRPGYNHVAQSMSELGEVGSPNATVMNVAGFMLLGLLMMAFAFALSRGIREGGGSKIGSSLVAMAGVSLVMVGFFPCDPDCVTASLTGALHDAFATIPAFAMILAPIVISHSLRNDSRWQGYWSYSMATGILAAMISLLLWFTFLEAWKGVIQRIGMGVPLLWMEVMAVRLLRLE